MEKEQVRALNVLLNIKEDHLKKLFLKKQELELVIKKNTEAIYVINEKIIEESRLSCDMTAFMTFPAFLKHSLEMIDAYEQNTQQISEEIALVQKKMKAVFTETKTIETIINKQTQDYIQAEANREIQYLDELSTLKEINQRLSSQQ